MNNTKFTIIPQDITIYIIGRNTAYISLANVLNLLHLYPEYKNSIIYADDNSTDKTFKLFKEYNLNFQKIFIDDKEISSFYNDKDVLYSIRNILGIKEVLSSCKTKYALIMHSDMFILNNEFMYQMFKDMEDYKVSSVEYLYESQKHSQYEQRMSYLINEYNNIKDNERKKHCAYYLNHYKNHYFNEIWPGLILINLKYFKDNGFPFCDRLDERNKNCVANLFSDTLQDFQCFLVENNINYKTYNMENNDNFVHFVHLSCANTNNLEKNNLETLLFASGIDSHKKHIENIMSQQRLVNSLKIVSKHTGLSIKKLLSEFSKDGENN